MSMLSRVIDALECRSHDGDKFKGEYSDWVLERLIKDSLNRKDDIINFLSGFDGYEADEYRVKFNVEYEVVYADYEIKRKLRELNDYLGSDLLNVISIIYSNDVQQIDTLYKNLFDRFDMKVSEGLKLGRAIRRIVDKRINEGTNYVSDIEKIYASLSDMMGTKKARETWYLSVSPFDFFRMSQGNSWDSCQHPSGCYASGITSYMMDKATAVLYREGSTGHELITRRLVYFDNNELHFSRIYGASRNVDMISDIIANIISNTTSNPITRSAYNGELSMREHSSASHYPDYNYHSLTSFKYENELTFYDSNEPIGYYPTCLVCGGHETPSEESYKHLNCQECAGNGHHCSRCGTYVNEDDVIYDDSREEYYCQECARPCANCGDWHDERDMTSTEDGDVCDSCLNNNYVSCEDCGEWIHENNVFVVEDDETGYTECYCEVCYNRR